MRGHHRRPVAEASVAGAGAAALLLVMIAPAFAAPSAHTSTSSNVTPIVECTAQHNGVNHTVFGYDNTGPTTTLSVGVQNQFTPDIPDRGQPTTFLPGTHINVFSVTTSATLTWTLDGKQVRAPDVLCQSTPAASSLAGWGPLGGLAIVTVLLGSLLFWRTHRARVRAR